MTPAIQCKYSCAQCGIYRRVVTIPQRTDAQDVVAWLEHVCAPALSRDHDQQSPHCHPTGFTEVIIPTPVGTDRVGALPPGKILPPGSPDNQQTCSACGGREKLLFKGGDGVFRYRAHALPGDMAYCVTCVEAGKDAATQ
jgi:hypothetical protein